MTLRRRRPGFTLLEVLLAMGIGLVLLGALYVAVDNQLQNTQAGREIVEQSTLARALLTRMGNDITGTITLSDPGRFRNAKSSSSSSSANAAAANAGSASASGSNPTDTGAGNTTVITVPLGLVGDSATLNLYVTRTPREVSDTRSDETPPPVSDTRRISYWLVGGGDTPGGGLAKMEVQPITSDDVAMNLPPGVDNEDKYIIADEVRSLKFSYFDGMNWNDTWDSTQPGADGVTPIGPPRAVKIEIEVPGLGGPDAPRKHYTHVVAIGTANGTTAQSQSTPGGGTSP